MFSLNNVLFLKERYAGAISCDDLQDKIYARLKKQYPLPLPIDSDPIDNIIYSLDTTGVCYVGLLDSPLNPAKQHYFTVFKTPAGIFRLEAYADSSGLVYGPRIVEWPTFARDLDSLKAKEPGIDRTIYWNGLFNAKETHDSLDEIVVEINFNTFF